MSLPTIQEYEQVVKNLMSPDNTVRGNAETYFNNSKAHPDFCVSSLIQLLRFSNDAQVRELSCLLVRKCIAKTEDSLYPKLSEEVKALVKKELISALESESIPTIRKKLTYAVSGLASGLLETGEYPELLPAMFNWTKSANPLHRESALLIFNQLATYLLDKGLSPYLKTLKAIFQSCLEDKESKKVRIAAITATTSVVLVLEKGPNRTLFQELISPMLSALGAALNERDSEGAQVAVESFIEIAEALPQFFKPKIIDVISAMFQIANTADLDESIRHLGMEFMITIAETAPTIVKKVPSFAQNLVPLCMNMMLDIEEDDEWNDTMTDDDQFELTNYDVGLEALDRLALALGGKLVQPIVFVCITPFLNSPDWKHRYAGLMTISQTAEGCKTQYETHLGEIVKMALALFKDPHPRVRYAAIHCTAQLSTDFSPNFQAVFHGMAVPALISAMDDEIPRVQCHAATAIVNFVEDCQHQFIEPYLDALLNKLLMLLQKGKRFVQEQTLSAISAVAGSSETLFRKYYSAIVPYLKVILTNATGQQDRMLRAKAMECVSLIGVAVGKEVFIQDAREIMDLLAKTQTSQMDPDDPQINYLLQAWARIAKCLGHDFIPYLEVVMPPLLASADIKPEVIVTDADEAQTEDEEGMESVTLSIKGVGDKRISIRTSVLEEKALACNMLYSYVYELKEGFFPYVDQVAKIMVPLLKFAYLDEIRETAATIMPELLKSVKARIEQGGVDPSLLKQLLDYILSAMLPALKIEPEVKTATILIEGFNDCIKAVPNDMVSQQHLESATQVLGEIVLASMQRRRNLESERDEQEDEEERDQYEEELYLEEELLSMTAECIGTLIKTQSAFLPYFAHRLPNDVARRQRSRAENRCLRCLRFCRVRPRRRSAIHGASHHPNPPQLRRRREPRSPPGLRLRYRSLRPVWR
eukprot:GEZU01024672.1.p1 GENE.GEZU01024672.1~~GEZU01024672.1.p1  ORF type:complete len:931 (-),score=263.30 GEZU01024672.1:811-3603(-)